MPATLSADKPRRARKAKAKARPAASETIQHVHETEESVATVELSPPHPPREETPEYAQTHKLLVFDKDTPCKVCQVRHSDLADPKRAADPTINRYGAKAIETHHYPIERSLLFAVDWRKVHDDFPAVYNQHSLEVWIDSPENMLVLCDQHHRSPVMGIHHLLTQDWRVQQYLRDGYRVAADAKDAAAALAADERIEQQSGAEAEVRQDIAAGVDPTATPPSPSPAPARPKRARKPRSPRPPKAA